MHSPSGVSSARGRPRARYSGAWRTAVRLRQTGGTMYKSVRAAALFFQKTIGWNRIGVLLSVAIISVAAVVLFHMLRDIDIEEVVAALKATEPQHIAAAAFFVACGYFTLTFYDLFALRTIGRNE